MGISPDSLAIAVEPGPVRFPLRRTDFRFFDIVVSLAMTSKIEELVRCRDGGFLAQSGEVMGEAFPRSVVRFLVTIFRETDEGVVAGVCFVDQT